MGQCMGGAWHDGGVVVIACVYYLGMFSVYYLVMCILPGLVGLDLGVGSYLDGDGEEDVLFLFCGVV